jgi:hypothetical protein
LPADAEKQLHQRVVCLQQIGFEFTLNHFRRLAVQACRIRGKAEWWEGAGLFSEEEPRLSSEGSRKSVTSDWLWLAEQLDMISSNFWGQQYTLWSCIQCGRYMT